MKTVYGYFNARAYECWLEVEDGDREQLYRAGNNPLESQSYLPPSRGVGLEKMKEYCTTTTKDYAEELGASYGGVHRQSVSDMFGDELAESLFPYDPGIEADLRRGLTW